MSAALTAAVVLASLATCDTAASVAEVTAAASSSASLPCNMTSGAAGDSVRLVLWFRGDMMTPVYSLDSRGKPLAEARHWSDDAVFGGRAFYTASHSPGRLVIDGVQPGDQATYTCRVDFKLAPTTISLVNLTVQTPPGKPVIYSPSGSEVRLKLGPYTLGEELRVRCLVVGGSPQPQVTWWRDHHLLDSSLVSVASVSPHSVEAVLTLPSLAREDLHSILTCQASNSNATVPVSTSVKLDMTYGPEALDMVGVRHSLSAGELYTIVCRARGSRPPPSISWRLGAEDVSSLVTELVTSSDGVTSSSLQLRARPRHHGQLLSCEAAVPGLAASRLDSASVLNVHHLGPASLQLGRDLASPVREGEDAYLECEVEANPRPSKVTWLKDGAEVRQQAASGIILSNLTLVLQRVSRTTAGLYSCRAANSEGSVTSNSLELAIEYKPVCAQEAVVRHEVGLNAQAAVVCRVEAAPEAGLQFHWVFNTSTETIDIQQDQMRVNGSTSTVDYIPRTPLDYGSLLCWASNSVGRQSQPCVFQLAPAPPPPRPAHCDLRHPAPGEAAVLCQSEEEEAGLSFVLELWRTQQPDTLLHNLTSSQPSWRLGGLEAGAEYSLAVFSRSEAGTSARYEASFRSRGQALALDPESRVHLDTLTITPILGALIGVGVALGLVTITILAVACCRVSPPRPRARPSKGGGYGAGEEAEQEQLAPDVVPSLHREHHQLGGHGDLGPGGQHVYTLDAGCCTTPTCYSTLQPRPRPAHYQLHYASLRRGPAPCPALAAPLLLSTSSSVVSSELNHSVTTSDTSDVSSERDRESEV